MEGFVDVGAGRVWYESAGAGPTVLLLHGGPGASSDYLQPIMRVANQGFRVVRYDQLGSFHSDKPEDPELWQVPRFVEEVEIVRSALNLGKVHLIGQSWGSFLALEYALTHSHGLASLVLYSGAASTRQCVAGMNKLRSELPADDREMLTSYENAGETNAPEYLRVVDKLLKAHLLRIDPWPAWYRECFSRTAAPVFETMWGPNEFTCAGNLRDWDRTRDLGRVTVPTLVLCGRYDEVIPECSETLAAGIPGAELHIFEESSHHAHLEQPEEFYRVLENFLARHRQIM
ncbi:MAG: proline iminopeptidase-family hydrolase [Thermomicrobiales bacterium]